MLIPSRYDGGVWGAEGEGGQWELQVVPVRAAAWGQWGCCGRVKKKVVLHKPVNCQSPHPFFSRTAISFHLF